ncbi:MULTISPECIES: hypothetical protein [unclassified Citrobacter]|uniref:hypothetical protein n=1 Tax=unclassified Citrobacter TaxID=2644389 RepID=UPI0017ACCA25|nr:MULTISPECIES: hypothetical protein [unclassified Citrobacter]HCJ6373754.1 hypothetical protein [Citrobacter freundii]MBA7965493.1 hypothetical protein [Citrobacter sp. RHBSTW-00671]MDW2643098.1 hypothetical protein [Citrobacter sp. HN-141]MDW2652273.1 hypothetical protein [Citrobacter sp. HN-120]MDW2695298.1 hypothetical protein [Citrobacter sp. HN-144]
MMQTSRPDKAFTLISGFLRNGFHEEISVSAKQIYLSAYRAPLLIRGCLLATRKVESRHLVSQVTDRHEY